MPLSECPRREEEVRPRPSSRIAPPPDAVVHPHFRALGPPLILIGMHRSGTSLTSLMLGILGAYMGPECQAILAEAPAEGPRADRVRDGYAEALDFRDVNDAALAVVGADWCSPAAFLEQQAELEFAHASHRRLAATTHDRLRLRYLRSLPEEPASAWGWKDPRNSLTLPHWLALFPTARIVHIRRDPAAAARSLNRRSRMWEEGTLQTAPVPSRVARLLSDPLSLVRGLMRRLAPVSAPASRDRCVEYEYALELSELYERECLREREGGGDLLEVWYEDLLANPHRVAQRLADFALLNPPEPSIQRAISVVRRGSNSGRPLW